MQKTISQQWAEYAVNLTFEDLSAEAISAAKMFIYDSFGCALGGSKTEDFHILEAVFGEIGGRGECSVIGSNLKTDVRSASLINGLAIRALDYNDVYWKQDPSHPSDLLPAAFCVGEREKKSGKDFLVATVIAYELEMRIMEAAFPGVREIGLHHATLTQFVSPVVAGKMLNLTAEQITNAIGISGSHNTTLGAVTAGKLTMMKNTVDPMATESGVFAALLAAKAYAGTTPIFEGREGLFEVIGDKWKPEVLTENLGKTFKIVDCSIKPFPCEALTHAPISAVLDLVLEYDLQPEQIETIEIHTLKRAAEILADEKKYIIDSRETADHSLPYCIAAAVVRRKLTPNEFNKESLADAQILETVPKVKAVLEPSFESRFPAEQPCKIVIKLTNGETLENERAYPKGDPRDQLSTAELKQKFSILAEDILDESQKETVYQTVYNLENVAEIGDLMKLLVK
ncbi:MAG TPA: MmgE/PrpD family protein [Pyrinomonadaceae bacterium]|nr:MmgE/PrpD family protein [Pyrinomonadaceae bacterium]